MKIGIIGAMAEEIISLKAEMTTLTTWEQAGNTFFQGKIGEQTVIVVQSGIGKVMSAMTATLLIHHYQVDVLLNTGSAGGIGEGLHVGDVVISEKLAYHDVDVTAFGYEVGQMAGMPLFYEADEKIVSLLRQVAIETDLNVKTGLITTSDSFIASQEKIDQIKHIFPDALATEMEGTAIAQVATQFNVPFAVVRAMSDVANEEASISFDDFIIEAGKKSAEMVIQFIKALPLS